MSQAQQYGPERAMMQSPHGAGQFVRGSGNINSKLAQGWTIVENDRNHLTRDVEQESKEGKAVVVDVDPVKTETTKAVEVQHKRPRIRDNNAKERGTR